MFINHRNRSAIGISFVLCGVLVFGITPARCYGVSQEELSKAAEQLDLLGSELAIIQSQLSTASTDLRAAEDATAKKDEEIVKINEDLKSKRTSLEFCLRDDYKVGQAGLLQYVFSSDDVGELLARLYYVGRVNEYRSDLIREVDQMRERLEREREELHAVQSAQKTKVDDLLLLSEDYEEKVQNASEVYNALDEEARAALREEASENVSTAVDAVEGSKDKNESKPQDTGGSSNGGGGSTGSQSGGSSVPPGTTAPMDDPTKYPGGSDTVNRRPDRVLGTVTWSNDMGYIDGMITLANRHGSNTDWFLTFDNQLLRFVALQRSGSTWRAVKTWNCIGAKATYSGKWQILHKRESNWYSESYDWFQNGNGPNAWSTDYIWGIKPNWSKNHERWVDTPFGSGYEDCAAIHGAGLDANRSLDKSNRGCCGLLNANAKWVYDNVPIGSTIYEFEYGRVGIF